MPCGPLCVQCLRAVLQVQHRNKAIAFDQSDSIYNKKSLQQAKIPFVMLYILLSNFDSIFNLCTHAQIHAKIAPYPQQIYSVNKDDQVGFLLAVSAKLQDCSVILPTNSCKFIFHQFPQLQSCNSSFCFGICS